MLWESEPQASVTTAMSSFPKVVFTSVSIKQLDLSLRFLSRPNWIIG